MSILKVMIVVILLMVSYCLGYYHAVHFECKSIIIEKKDDKVQTQTQEELDGSKVKINLGKYPEKGVYIELLDRKTGDK